MSPLFSIIMASYLSEYPGGAKDRENKFIRAVDSVIEQSFKDWELIIVADGCDRTTAIYTDRYQGDERISCYRIPKSEQWCPSVRNAGLTKAIGTWAAYLDTDDYFGPDHLDLLARSLMDEERDWAWFNTWWYGKNKAFYEKQADIKKCAGHGTANVVHRIKPDILWPTQARNRSTGKLDYGTQDCAFTDTLKRLPGAGRIMTPEYYVCHLPAHVAGSYDV